MNKAFLYGALAAGLIAVNSHAGVSHHFIGRPDVVNYHHRVPPPRYETRPHRPAANYTWVEGQWVWRGGRYVWVSGYWGRPPRPRAVWVPGHWETHRHGHVWVEGCWR